MAIVSSTFKDLRISLKHSMVLCDNLRGKKVKRARTILSELINEKYSLNGKYYTNASKEFLSILRTMEENARKKNMNLEKLAIRRIKPDRGYAFRRPRSRWRLRGRRVKSTSITIEIEER